VEELLETQAALIIQIVILLTTVIGFAHMHFKRKWERQDAVREKDEEKELQAARAAQNEAHRLRIAKELQDKVDEAARVLAEKHQAAARLQRDEVKQVTHEVQQLQQELGANTELSRQAFEVGNKAVEVGNNFSQKIFALEQRFGSILDADKKHEEMYSTLDDTHTISEDTNVRVREIEQRVTDAEERKA